MRFDVFLSSPRWEILQILAKKPSSPIELAEELSTTVSYMSQQLKILDAANLVTKIKTGAAEKGKPRSVFSLAEEFVYLVNLTKPLAEKKLLRATEYHKRILKIWLLEDSSLHYYFEKFFWMLEDNLKEIEGIFLDVSALYPKMIVVSDSKKLILKIQTFVSNLDRKIIYEVISRDKVKKIVGNSWVVLHDPFGFKEIELKGGTREDYG